MTKLIKANATKKWDDAELAQAFDEVMEIKWKYGLTVADFAQLLDTVRIRVLSLRVGNPRFYGWDENELTQTGIYPEE